MAIQDTINSIENNIGQAYSALSNKGATMPQSKNIQNLTSAINSLPQNPILATTDAEMAALLTSSNDGKVVKFTGTSETYETDTYYVIEEEES